MHIKQSAYKLPRIMRRPILVIISGMEAFIWNANNRPLPLPHSEKVKILQNYIQKFRPNTFVETGTYLGQTVDDLIGKVSLIYSIELDKKLANNAKRIFAGNKEVNILQGDSSQELKKILKKINSPALFWLDAHYSGGITSKGKKLTPIMDELNLIRKNIPRNSVILIDDAREFSGKNGYPKIQKIYEFVEKKLPNHKISVKQDIIRIYPKK